MIINQIEILLKLKNIQVKYKGIWLKIKLKYY